MRFHVFKTEDKIFHAVANLQSNADLNPFNYIHYYKCVKYFK